MNFFGFSTVWLSNSYLMTTVYPRTSWGIPPRLFRPHHGCDPSDPKVKRKQKWPCCPLAGPDAHRFIQYKLVATALSLLCSRKPHWTSLGLPKQFHPYIHGWVNSICKKNAWQKEFTQVALRLWCCLLLQGECWSGVGYWCPLVQIQHFSTSDPNLHSQSDCHRRKVAPLREDKDYDSHVV